MLNAPLQDTLDSLASVPPLTPEAVVIGVSYGAVQVLNVLLPRLARGLRVPVIVVVHQIRGRASLLPGLFRSLCAAPVDEPCDKQPVAPGTIWFAPPDYHLFIEMDRTFALSIDPPVGFSRPSIDLLFESAASAYGARLVAVLLSGANDDGARGAASIRRAGGYIMVQDPTEAPARAMPSAAIRSADPQFVGHVEEIAAILSGCSGGSP